MNIQSMIREFLESQGCRIEEDSNWAIWTVTTPDGKKWDFSKPLEVENDLEPEEDEIADDPDAFLL